MKKLFSVGLLMLSVLMLATIFLPTQLQALAHAVPHGMDVYNVLVVSSTGAMTAGVCLPITHIVAEDCGANPGGLTDLHVIRRRDIMTFPEPSADGVTIATAIVPKAGEGFVKWEFASDTGDLNHKSGGDQGNQSITHEINTYVPRGIATIDAVINAAINGDFVVIGTDSNGNLRILGDKRRGVKFDYDYKSGKKGTDKNGTDFKFTGEGFTHVPFYYTAAIPLKAAA
ncbi:hypothetical protein LJY25_08205 [Hymenobacter sp. BT175]|uniref:hypothetical protein n=1 Tax=Hymenobacter translucens TaxID=2886507 RepID=UPI001D0E6593|nr:hypothetical protein [Hymenobacter translucens]MCC2546424.1 hypothetical protein [Hymenobacter translucens]